jgi:hypothetical protein
METKDVLFIVKLIVSLIAAAAVYKHEVFAREKITGKSYYSSTV